MQALNSRSPLGDWLDHLERLHPKGQAGIELGLERVRRVSESLQQKPWCPLITVAGTNGKGSTCAYIEAIASHAGYRVGCYTSPHLLTYNERVRVDRRPVADAALAAAFARVEAARQAAGEVALTYFEFGTLAAWEVFAAERVDLVVLEVGLGGRLDAVNVYDADCAVVTGIALDHTDWLGNTREAIGYEKAGIYRCGRPAICVDAEPPASLLAHAAAIGADLQCIGRDFAVEAGTPTWSYRGRGGHDYCALPLPSLCGAYQMRNAAGALAACQTLASRLPVSEAAVRQGLCDVALAGRFQVLAGRPTYVADVAHNPQAVAVLAANLAAQAEARCGGYERTIAVVGMLADKDVAGALRVLQGRIDHWLLASLDVPRGASAELLAQVHAAQALGGTVACHATPENALVHAAKLAGENDRIVVFGSFHTVAAFLRASGQGA